jgi:hypothetical protein
MKKISWVAILTGMSFVVGSSTSPATNAAVIGVSIDAAPNTSSTSASIPAGTSSYSFDLHFSSGGLSFDGLDVGFQTTGPGSLIYGSTPVAISGYDTPFVSADIFFSPLTGSTLNNANNPGSGKTDFSKSASASTDYGAVSNSPIATYTINTSSLAVGSYTITPILDTVTSNVNATETSGFATPTAFTLNVTPEPASLSLVLLGGGALLMRRRQRQHI